MSSKVDNAVSSSEHLLVFTKVPQLGSCKTRLIPAVGAEKAMELFRCAAKLTLASAEEFARRTVGRVTIVFSDGSIEQAQREFGDSLNYVQQQGIDLGERMSNAVGQAINSGAQKVVVIGTDCLDLTVEDLIAAFGALDTHDIVLGPASDGGYFLIGVTAWHRELFQSIDWSTDQVLQQTVQKANSIQATHCQIRTFDDIDHPEDLIHFRRSGHLLVEGMFKTVRGRLSIIVPTLNEEQNLPRTLLAIGQLDKHTEVIVCDAGSSDATVELAQQFGCKVIIIDRGRGAQLNAGAAIASGEFLMFLHADTVLPSGYFQEVQRILSGKAVAGAFQLKIDAGGLGLRLIERAVALRSRFLQLPYGDQAIFLRSVDFYHMKGFKLFPIMEDYELIDRLRNRGKIVISPQAVQTSARRWRSTGIVKTTLINQYCVLLYRLGISTESIAKFYRRQRSDSR